MFLYFRIKHPQTSDVFGNNFSPILGAMPTIRQKQIRSTLVVSVIWRFHEKVFDVPDGGRAGYQRLDR